MIHDAKLRWLTISADNGRLLDRNPHTWRIPATIHAFADTTYPTSVGPCSTVPAARCDGDHLIRPSARARGRAAAACGGGASKPAAAGDARESSASRRAWPERPQTIVVDPYDYRLGP
jgi:hypothetical protein